MRRILSLAVPGYLDHANQAGLAQRALLGRLARHGFSIEVISGATLRLGQEVDPAVWLNSRGFAVETSPLTPPPSIPAVAWPYPSSLLRLSVDGVRLSLLRGPSARPHAPDEAEVHALLSLFDLTLERFRPEVLLVSGNDVMAPEVLRLGRARGLVTVLRVSDCSAREARAALLADHVLAPSQFAADYLKEVLALPVITIPDIVDHDRIRAEAREPRFVTFFGPSPRNGLQVFARIAGELGRRRPEVPLLVVAGPEGKAALDGCGLDLRAHGGIQLMAPPLDPRRLWERTRIVLIPSLDWACPPSPAVEAMINGLPVIASARGSLPETLGEAGIVLGLPDRLTPVTRILPTAEEVAPWVEAILRLWDEADYYEEHRRRALAEAMRWAPEPAETRCVDFFRALQPGPRPPIPPPPGRAQRVVLVPHLNGIEPECEDGLRQLERAGIRVIRRRGSSQIDVARNEMASDAVHDGFESILFIDADVGFDPFDALRLLARPEPIISGLYAKKHRREFASSFAAGVDEVGFGNDALGPYPLKHAATGFLRIKVEVLRRMIQQLGLPLCNQKWGRGVWPFFQPVVVALSEGGSHYLGEDWAFSHRLGLIGITPLADASIRLWHYGSYGFGWEDAGSEHPRHGSYRFKIQDSG